MTAICTCSMRTNVLDDGDIEGEIDGDMDDGIHCLSPMELFLFHVNTPGNDVLLYGCVWPYYAESKLINQIVLINIFDCLHK